MEYGSAPSCYRAEVFRISYISIPDIHRPCRNARGSTRGTKKGSDLGALYHMKALDQSRTNEPARTGHQDGLAAK